jgi:hypothetical protein
MGFHTPLSPYLSKSLKSTLILLINTKESTSTSNKTPIISLSKHECLFPGCDYTVRSNCDFKDHLKEKDRDVHDRLVKAGSKVT